MGQLDATDFRSRGFKGFITVAQLRSRPERAPPAPGVYVVLRESAEPPTFLYPSPASWFKGKDPTVSVERLQAEWVEDVALLYVGSGDNLRRRIDQLVDFSHAGPAKSVGHYGGRLLWQVEGSQRFLVAWQVTAAACFRTTERELVDEFSEAFGRMPFANLRRPPGCR